MALLIPDISDWLQSFRPTREAAIGFALIGLYYLVVWLAVGSDPEQGTIVVSYDPPRGLSPATLRYLCKKGFDEKGFSSALLNLAVKKFVEIESCENFYRLNRGTADVSVLSPEEKTLTDILMRRDPSFDLKEEHQHRVYLAIRAMSHTLDLAITKTYLRINRNYLLPGIRISAPLRGKPGPVGEAGGRGVFGVFRVHLDHGVSDSGSVPRSRLARHSWTKGPTWNFHTEGVKP